MGYRICLDLLPLIHSSGNHQGFQTNSYSHRHTEYCKCYLSHHGKQRYFKVI
jgi:hypothetical protein